MVLPENIVKIPDQSGRAEKSGGANGGRDGGGANQITELAEVRREEKVE